MSIFTLIIIILLCGFVCYLVYNYASIPAGFKTLIYIVLMAVCILYVLSAFGLLSGLYAPVPSVRVR